MMTRSLAVSPDAVFERCSMWARAAHQSPSFASIPAIKGNINRDGEHIYHLPFQQFYPRGSHELSSTSIMRQAAGPK